MKKRRLGFKTLTKDWKKAGGSSRAARWLASRQIADVLALVKRPVWPHEHMKNW